MKRMLSVVFGLMALAALMAVPAVSFACDGEKSAQTAQVGQTAHNHMASANGQCTPGEAAACAAKMGMSVEECQKLCASGEYTMVNMSIKGMTCGGCESSVTASLAQMPGVVKVGKVSYKEGTAFVMVDPKKVKSESLLKAVSDKGFQAEIVPAVSVTTVDSKATGNANHPCGPEAAKSCAKSCAKSTGTAQAKPEKTGGGL
ncbi:MAG: cation transporter [Candidatus Zixiibacteriota bacterium]